VLTALSLLTACAVAAKAGLLPGGPDGAPQYADSMILRDVGATVLTAALGHAFVWINTAAVSAGRLDPRDARKSIHTLSAPLFMLFWPLFSEAAGARFFAATVPTVNAVRLYLASQTDRQQQQEEETEAVSSEAALAAAVSRSGDSREALGGPFIYVVVLAVCILLWWRDSPAGVVALAALAAGDGAADLVGRRYGSVKWPWSADGKSVAGSAAFWVSSTLTAVGLLRWMQWTGCLTVLADVPVTEWAAKVALICFVSAALEVMPAAGDDNYTVPISAALLSVVLL
jgi:phytol kinase